MVKQFPILGLDHGNILDTQTRNKKTFPLINVRNIYNLLLLIDNCNIGEIFQPFTERKWKVKTY